MSPTGRNVIKAGQKIATQQPEVADKAKKTVHLPLDIAMRLKTHVAKELGKGIRVTETEIIVTALREWLAKQ